MQKNISKKYSYEDIQNLFAEVNYTLKSTEYKYNTKLSYSCDNGHEGSILLKNFVCGQRCKKCAVIKLFDNKKNKWEEIEKYYIENECVLMSKKEEYKNMHSVLTFKCKHGHEDSISYNLFKVRKNKCKSCFNISVGKEPNNTNNSITKNIPKVEHKRKTSIETIRKDFSDFNCILLSDEYEGYDEPLLYKCPMLHECSLSYHKWKMSKTKCSTCGRIESGNKQKFGYDFVKQKFLDSGFELLEDTYINKKQKLRVKCKNEHIFAITFDSFYYAKNGCSTCSQKKKHTLEEVKKEFENFGYVLLSDSYKDNKQKLEYKCEEGHLNSMRFNDFKSGYRCPTCMNSKGETMICNILDKLHINYSKEHCFKDCVIKKPARFDFFVENKYIIEYDGLQHFQSIDFFGGEKEYQKRKKSDCIKSLYCVNNDIPLLRISCFEFEKSETENIINNFLEQLKNKEQSVPIIMFSNKSLYTYIIDEIHNLKKIVLYY